MEEVKDYPPYHDYPKPRKQQSNADRIRAMSDEELAEEIMCPYGMEAGMCTKPSDCLSCCLEWLRQPVQPTPEVPDTHEHSGLFGEE